MLGTTEEENFLDCVEKGNLQMVKQHLTNSGNINARRYRRTDVSSSVDFLPCHIITKCYNQLRDGALHIAGWMKNQEMLSMLIDAGADINMKNKVSSSEFLHHHHQTIKIIVV